MLFQNASKGLRYVFSSELFELLGTMLFSISSTITASAGGTAARVIAALASLVLLVLALVRSVKGLRLAAMDDSRFRIAYEFTVGLLIVEMIYIVFGVLATWVQFFDRFALSGTLVSLFALLSNIFVALGIRNLYVRREENKNAAFAMVIAILTIIGGVLDVALMLFNSYLTSIGNVSAMVAISVGYVIFVIVTYILYLVLLNKGSKDFA